MVEFFDAFNVKQQKQEVLGLHCIYREINIKNSNSGPPAPPSLYPVIPGGGPCHLQ